MKELCRKCKKPTSGKTEYGFCRKCSSIEIARIKTEEKFLNWLETGDMGISVAATVRGTFRERLLLHYGNKCSICGQKPEWNGLELVLVLDHIDGNAGNDKETNLRFICPNCDSQLETFKSKNRESARRHRKKV